MGNLAFDISKIVDLNKVVTLDIDKNVDVTVDNSDILATAEADAEAFGPNALAEVDAFTYVNVNGDGGGEYVLELGLLDFLGNSTNFELGELVDIDVVDEGGSPAGTFTVAQELSIELTGPANADGLPDIDDLNSFGKLEPVDIGIEGSSDNPLPIDDGDNFFAFSDDLNLVLADDPGAILRNGTDLELEVEYEYIGEDGGDLIINFGTQVLDILPIEAPDESELGICSSCDPEEGPFEGELLLTIPNETKFLVTYEDAIAGGNDVTDGPIEIEFLEFAQDGADRGFYTFNGVEYEVQDFALTADSLGTEFEISDWAIEADALFPQCEVCSTNGDGEAFAYAESTSALDLNGDDMMALSDII